MKFYEDNRLALFDLSKDLKEQNNVSRKLPDETARLHKRLQDYLAAVDAQMPVVNPQYDPDRPPTPRKKGRTDKDRSGNGGGKKRHDYEASN